MERSETGYPDCEELKARAAGAGFPICGFLDLRSFIEEYTIIQQGERDTEGPLFRLKEAFEEGGRGVIVTARPIPLPLEAADSSQNLPEPEGIIAPFAAQNHYRESVTDLKKVVSGLCSQAGLRKRDFRIFSNSRFPEKALAAAAGIGFLGKNSLLITRTFGSAVILSGIILPWVPQVLSGTDLKVIPKPGESCGDCSLCAEACPGGAIDGSGQIDKKKCLQAMSTGEMKRDYFEAWGCRLYGCQLCQDICPWNRRLESSSRTPSSAAERIRLDKLLSTPRGEVKNILRETAMTQSWIREKHILRNGLLAAGNHPEGKKLRPVIEKYLLDEEAEVREAAAWALERITLSDPD